MDQNTQNNTDGNQPQQPAEAPPSNVPLSQQPNVAGNPYAANPAGEDPGKTMGIVGIILAILFPIAGLVLGILSRNKSKAAGFSGGLGLAALIVSALNMLMSIIIIVLAIASAGEIVDEVNKSIEEAENNATSQTLEAEGGAETKLPAGDQSTGSIPFDSLSELDFVCTGEGFPANAVASPEGKKKMQLFTSRPLSDDVFSAESVFVDNEDNRTDYENPTYVDFVGCMTRGETVSDSKTCQLKDDDDNIVDYPLISSTYKLKVYDLFTKEVVLEKDIKGENECPSFLGFLYDEKLYDNPDRDVLEFEVTEFLSTQ